MRSADPGRRGKLDAVRNMSVGLAKLSGGRRLSRPALRCEDAQPRWGNRSQGAVITGSSWRICRIAGGCSHPNSTDELPWDVRVDVDPAAIPITDL